jgi:RNA polymerase sigma factor (sigma-70 family)
MRTELEQDQRWADQVAEVVQRAADGDREAWEAIVQQYSGLIWSVVRGFRLGEHQSADVVQVCWLRLVENLNNLRDPRRLPSWLATTARNASVEALRQSKRLRPIDDAFEPVSTDEPPDELVLRQERVQSIRAALVRLSERDQQLLNALVATPPMSYQEIGSRFGMPIGSIGPTRMRALRRLREELVRAGALDGLTP